MDALVLPVGGEYDTILRVVQHVHDGGGHIGGTNSDRRVSDLQMLLAQSPHSPGNNSKTSGRGM